MARSQKDMQDEIERNKERIEALEKELRESRSNEKGLEDKVKSLEKEIQDLKDKNEDLVKQLQEMEGKIEKLEKENEDQKAQKQHDDYVLILAQIGLALQRNMCEYVFGSYFEHWRYYKFKEIKNYIYKDIDKPDDKVSAKTRLQELKTKIPWDPDLVDSLKNLTKMRNGIAHPDLTSDKIQEATKFLSERGELVEKVEENVNKLKEKWETSETLLQRNSAGGPRKVPITGQKHSTDANNFVNGRPRKRPRKS